MNAQLHILKKHEDLLTAQYLAQAEYEKLFKQFHRHISKATHVILRERFMAEGKIAYLIRVEFTENTSPSDLRAMENWAAEHITSDPTNAI